MFNEWMDGWGIAIFKGRKKEHEELAGEKFPKEVLIKTPATFSQRFIFHLQTFDSQYCHPFQIRATIQASMKA